MEINPKAIQSFNKNCLQHDCSAFDWRESTDPLLLQYGEMVGYRLAEAKILEAERALATCDSPIEQLFLSALITLAHDQYEDIFVNSGDYKGPIQSWADLFVFTQHKIGKYTADFLIAGRHMELPHSPEIRRSIVVECDGHDFHERTKEQAQRDRKRDRDIQALGYKILRFTGSEIFRAPFDCASTALEFVSATGPKNGI